MERGALPGRKPGIRVRWLSVRVASATARVSSAAGSSTSRMTVLFSDGVVVTCMAAKYTGGLRGAPHGGLVGEEGVEPTRHSRDTGS